MRRRVCTVSCTRHVLVIRGIRDHLIRTKCSSRDVAHETELQFVHHCVLPCVVVAIAIEVTARVVLERPDDHIVLSLVIGWLSRSRGTRTYLRIERSFGVSRIRRTVAADLIASISRRSRRCGCSCSRRRSSYNTRSVGAISFVPRSVVNCDATH